MDRLLVLTRHLQHGAVFRALSSRLLSTKSSSSSSSSSSDDEKKIGGNHKSRERPSKLPLSSASSSSSSSGDEAKKALKKRSDEALEKLNNLLGLMIKDEGTKTEKKLELSKPINRRKKPEEKTEKREKATPEKKLTSAVKSVAESLGGDVKQTESELLSKLLDTAKTEKNLRDVLAGISVETTRADKVKEILKKTRSSGTTQIKSRRPSVKLEKIDLFGTEPLGIFTELPQSEGLLNETWDKLYNRDMKLAVTQPPSNYFQQMILWTDQKKVWRFPIDNEQDIGDEKNVPFDKHVFLEKYLVPWCPQKGPIRHFMELVCVGLSKNPYLTVEAKKEHILWFKTYFEGKQDLLRDVGLSLESTEAKVQEQIEPK